MRGGAREDPNESGKMVCHGEIWDVRAEMPLKIDAQVRVLAVDGRTLRVVPHQISDPPPVQQRS